METLFFECAIRAALLVAGTAVVLQVLRVKNAAAQHKVWSGVVLVMLLLPAWTAWGPKAALRILPAVPQQVSVMAPAPAIPELPADFSQSETNIPVAPVTIASSSQWNWQTALLGIYLLGVAALLLRLAIGAARAHRLIRHATLHQGRLTSSAFHLPGLQVQPGPVAAPVTVGWFRPRVILPEDWPTWPQAKLEAVLTHEGEHASRRDLLWQSLALFNRAFFWLHPAAWWLERRLAALAEEACDDVVLARGHSPSDYSEYLMDMARAVTRAGARINIAGVAMPGSSLPRRIKRIIDGAPISRMSRKRMALAATACAITCTALAAARIDHALTRNASPASRLQSSSSPGQFSFDSVSIKLRASGPDNWIRTDPDQGLLSATFTLRQLLMSAYVLTATVDGEHPRPIFLTNSVIPGAPEWIDSVRFDIEAKTSSSTSPEQWRLMIQTLLADRFHLIAHYQEHVVPGYRLVLSRTGTLGPQLRPHISDGSGLSQDGSCWDPAVDRPASAGTGRPLVPYCGGFRIAGCDGFPGWCFNRNQTMGQLAANVAALLDGPTVDSTGLSGRFDYDLVIDYRKPLGDHSTVLDYSTVSTALEEQLGLKLVSQPAPIEYLVIDHVEMPAMDQTAQGGAANLTLPPQQFVDAIIFDGNRRVGSQELASRIFLRPGDRFDDQVLRRDYMALWNSGFFDDIQMEVRDNPNPANGTIVVFHLKERPVLRQIQYQGFAPIEASSLENHLKNNRLEIVTESPLDRSKIERAAALLKALLAENGRPSAVVTTKIEVLPGTNAVRLVITAVEASQTASPRPRFDTVSIGVETTPTGKQVIGGWLGPGPFKAANATFRVILSGAYQLSGAQTRLISGAPEWMDSVRFNIEASAQGDPGIEEKRLMEQSMLADHFKLIVHYETKVVPIYTMELADIGRTGPALVPHSENAKCTEPSLTTPASALTYPVQSGDPLPAFCGGIYSHVTRSLSQRTANKITMEGVAQMLSGDVDRPVLDMTGLSGAFDLELSVRYPTPQTLVPVGQPRTDLSPLFVAVRDQLGLRLVPTNGPVEVLAIDHVEMPVEGTF